MVDTKLEMCASFSAQKLHMSAKIYGVVFDKLPFVNKPLTTDCSHSDLCATSIAWGYQSDGLSYRPTSSAAALRLHCVSKNVPSLFVNYSIDKKSQLFSIIFGTCILLMRCNLEFAK